MAETDWKAWAAGIEMRVAKLEAEVASKRGTAFKPPTEADVFNYVVLEWGDRWSRQACTKTAQDFWEYYESNGWMVGRVKMKDWKRAMNRWVRNSKPTIQSPAGGLSTTPAYHKSLD
jgi:archaellum component FlaD/FlaE